MSSLVILSNAELWDLLAFLESTMPLLPPCLAAVPAKLQVALKFIPPVPLAAPSPLTLARDENLATSYSLKSHHSQHHSQRLIESPSFVKVNMARNALERTMIWEAAECATRSFSC